MENWFDSNPSRSSTTNLSNLARESMLHLQHAAPLLLTVAVCITVRCF
jgi:hypothetical protein